MLMSKLSLYSAKIHIKVKFNRVLILRLPLHNSWCVKILLEILRRIIQGLNLRALHE